MEWPYGEGDSAPTRYLMLPNKTKEWLHLVESLIKGDPINSTKHHRLLSWLLITLHNLTLRLYFLRHALFMSSKVEKLSWCLTRSLNLTDKCRWCWKVLRMLLEREKCSPMSPTYKTCDLKQRTVIKIYMHNSGMVILEINNQFLNGFAAPSIYEMEPTPDIV